MNLAREPTAFARRYRNSEINLSVVLAARSDVDGFGGRDARKSPYAGPSWSFKSGSVSTRSDAGKLADYIPSMVSHCVMLE